MNRYNTYKTGVMAILRQWAHGVLLLMAFTLLTAQNSQANNISVTNVRLLNSDVSAGVNNAANFTFVRFDIRWENAWRLNYAIGMNNNDAAWVFVKYRILGGTWRQATLNLTGHNVGTWTGQGAGPALIETGLLTPAGTYDVNTNPVLGVFISNGSINPEPGLFEATNVRLRWNYGAQGVPDAALLEIQVTAIEMVYAPQVPFYVGTGGLENGSFTNGSWVSGATIPLRIGSDSALTIGTAAGNLWGRSSSGDSTIGSAGTLSANFPKGYTGYYAMKYEITQRQWVDFFNSLYDAQKVNRDITGADGKNSDALTDRNNISWTTDDATLPSEAYANVACNYLSWSDVAAYLDWAALRPMTELEFEKLSRGERTGVANEYTWGTNDITVLPYALANAGGANSIVSSNYSSAAVGGNAWYSTTHTSPGPVRVGIFAADTASTGRTTASAARYGGLEMSGNVWEHTVSVASDSGRLYTGVHGDGLLTPTGFADVVGWPTTTANGTGLRGGAWNSAAARLRVSDRALASNIVTSRNTEYGGRGVRSLPCTVPVVQPAVIGLDTLAQFGNVLELTTSGATGSEGYLWVLPGDWRIISGQGSATLFVATGATPATLLVMVANSCGAGVARTISF